MSVELRTAKWRSIDPESASWDDILQLRWVVARLSGLTLESNDNPSQRAAAIRALPIAEALLADCEALVSEPGEALSFEGEDPAILAAIQGVVTEMEESDVKTILQAAVTAAMPPE